MKLGIHHLHLLEAQDTLAFDTETTGLQPTYGGLRLFQFTALGCESVVLDAWDFSEEDWTTLGSFFARPRTWVAHNAVFDLGWLQVHDIYPEGKVACTMLASQMLRNGVPGLRHGLAPVAAYYLKEEVDKTQQTSNWGDPNLSREQIEYASKDAQLVARLWDVMQPRLAQARLLDAFALECGALQPLALLNRTGMPFDRDALVALEGDYARQIQELGDQFVQDLDAALPPGEKLPRLESGEFNLNAKPTGSVRQGNKVPAGFNLNAPAQLVAKFTILLGEAPISPKTGKPSAAKEALRGYAADSPVVQTYLSWKRAEKRRQMVQSLLEHQQADGFIRSQYVQLGAGTGRLSCVAGDTVLITSRGDFRFDEYIPQLGDTVLTHKGRWRPVVRKLYRGVEETYELVTAEGGRICCTADHKFWTGTQWVALADLSVGDTLGLFKEVGSRSSKHRSCTKGVPKRGQTHCLPSSGYTEHLLPQCDCCPQAESFAGKETSRESTEAVSRQDWFAKPYEGQEWFPAPQIHRQCRRPQGLPNGARRQRRSSIQTQTCDGTGAWTGDAPSAVRGASHRQKWQEQQLGQLGSGDPQGTQSYTQSTTHVESIKHMGAMGVWDIEVMEDHSYTLYGLISHNCRNPNLQQVPRDKGFRKAAAAPPGWKFVVADFGQMELRLAAAVSGDRRMSQAFKDGEDLHTVTATAIYPDPSDDKDVLKARRQVAKSANFGLLYGSGAKGLRDYAASTGVTLTLDEAKQIRDTFLTTYKGISSWQQQCAGESDRTKGDKWAAVRIPGSDFRRFLPGEMNRLTTRCNTPIQGAGAAVLKLALANLWPMLRQAGEEQVKLSGVVHDEVVLLVRDGLQEQWCKILSQVMEEAEAKWLGEIPPLAEAASGDTWADAK